MGTGASATKLVQGASFEDVCSAFRELPESDKATVQGAVHLWETEAESEWNQLMKMLGLEQSTEVSQELWDAAFDAIKKQSVDILAKKDWTNMGGNPVIFTNISGSDTQDAAVSRSKWHEAFAQVGKEQDEAQRWFRSLNLEHFLAKSLPKAFLLCTNKENPLDCVLKLGEDQINCMVEQAARGMTLLIKSSISDARKVMEATKSSAASNRSSKFSGTLTGGDLDDYYAGVAKIVGEPHTNLKEGVEKEHLQGGDADLPFTTVNYGITTTPKTEHSLLAQFSGEGGYKVAVSGTRRCEAEGVIQEAKVKVRSAFESDAYEAVQLEKGLSGVVEELDKEGRALIKFGGKLRRVCKANFDKLGWTLKEQIDQRFTFPMTAIGSSIVNSDRHLQDEADHACEGAKVEVQQPFMSDALQAVGLQAGQEGVVADLDEGRALIKFWTHGHVNVCKEKFAHLESVSKEDTRTLRPMDYYFALKAAGAVNLTWVEIFCIVLYTGPMFVIYNGILRGVGFCGEVQKGVPFWSKDGRFEAQHKSTSVKDRVEKAGHSYPSTVHSLTSAVKKLQRVRSGVQGTWLYRGLGGLDISEFLEGNGYTERAFTSTTKSLAVALEYSGAKLGNAGTVLALKMSEVDQGAVLREFSQYPGEEETLWNACSYLEALKGKEEWKLTQWGPVKVVYIKMNASGKASTVEELEARRKTIVVNMLETIKGDVDRLVLGASSAHEFQKKVRKEVGDFKKQQETYTMKFVEKAVGGSKAVVDKYKAETAAWFHPNEHFATSVASAAELPDLAQSWISLYRDDTARRIDFAHCWNFLAAKKDLCRFRQDQLKVARLQKDGESEVRRPAASSRSRHSLQNDGESEVQRLAGALCYMRGYAKGANAMNIDIDKAMIDGSDETPLLENCMDSVWLAAKLLLEARADPVKAHTKEGVTCLHFAGQEGQLVAMKMMLELRADPEAVDSGGRTPLHRSAHFEHTAAVQVLLERKANIEVKDHNGWTPLCHSAQGGHVATMQVLLKIKANVEATTHLKQTSLHVAAINGHAPAVQVLLESKANAEAKTSKDKTPLHYAAEEGHNVAMQALLDSKASIEAKATRDRDMTPLHYSTENGHVATVRVLLERKASMEAKESHQHSAMDIARRAGSKDIGRLLQEAAGGNISHV